MSLEQEIKDHALALGFAAAGITDAAPLDRRHVAHFEAWLRAGCAGRMQYMQRHPEQRVDPGRLLEGAQSVIVVALACQPPPENPAPVSPTEPTGKVAQYAQYEDYHPFIRSRLRGLADFIRVRAGREHRYRICVDSAPVAEKALAARAGLGFIGRHHLLIHPRLGPQLLLGEILTTVRLGPDEPAGGTCGDCRACRDACPTGALRADGLLEARRCISYLTQYAAQDAALQDTAGWIFGCDECLLACPFTRSAPPPAPGGLRHYPERARLNLRDLLGLTPATFAARFHDSPLGRVGLEALQHLARRCMNQEFA